MVLQIHYCALTTELSREEEDFKQDSNHLLTEEFCSHLSDHRLALLPPSLPFINVLHPPHPPNNNTSVSVSSLHFPHLMQPRPHLQLSWGHFGSQLNDTANSHACSTGRVQLVPNGVTVHLSKQSAGSTEGEKRKREEKGEKRVGREEGKRKQIREEGLAD